MKSQNLVVDFPVDGKKTDPKTGELLGYFADVQHAQIPVNNTQRGHIYQNPHVYSRRVDYYGKSIDNHRMFININTVHKMMKAAQKNSEIVYHFNNDGSDAIAHTAHTGGDLAYPNEKTTSEMNPLDLTKTTIAVCGDLKHDSSGLDNRLVIDPNSNFKPAKGVNLRLQDDLMHLACAKSGKISQTPESQMREASRVARYLNERYSPNIVQDDDCVVQIKKNKNNTYSFNMQSGPSGINAGTMRVMDNLTPSKLYNELNSQYHKGNLILERSVADRLFTPFAKSVGQSFDSRGGYTDRLDNYRTTLNISNRLSQAMRSAHKHGFNLKYTYGAGSERNNLINLKHAVDAPTLNDFKFDFKLTDKNNKTLCDVRNVSAGDIINGVLQLDDAHHILDKSTRFDLENANWCLDTFKDFATKPLYMVVDKPKAKYDPDRDAALQNFLQKYEDRQADRDDEPEF